jgi:diaminohydroxyphosphoribosylaminopyrimidine deaminase/5-amino-6-(5-phosphoribosylamino)uracil reductase
MRRVGDNSVTSPNVDELMRRAIEATRSTHPHPNPRVGAVVTSIDGAVTSVAAHQMAGQPHAEILALEASTEVRGGTLVVTLEPCNHHGRTPPCTDAIIDAGISRVVVGALDPDERVSGDGVARLSEAGIDVTVGVLETEVRDNDPGYFHHRRTGMPRVTLKMASTIDGQAGAADGSSQWITSEEARRDAHHLRAANDVVIVGMGTVVADDPRLDVRLEGYTGHQPRPVVIAGRRDMPKDRQLWERDPIIYQADASSTMDPRAVVADLGQRGFVSAMVEGGPTLAASFLSAGVVDQVVWYIGAKIAAGRGTPAVAGVFETMTDIQSIDIVEVRRLGPDLRISATISKER